MLLYLFSLTRWWDSVVCSKHTTVFLFLLWKYTCVSKIKHNICDILLFYFNVENVFPEKYHVNRFTLDKYTQSAIKDFICAKDVYMKHMYNYT